MDRIYARGPNGPIHSDDWAGEDVRCYITHEKLKHIQSHSVRAHKRLKVSVRAHKRNSYFRGITSTIGKGMSIQHKAAQDKILRAFEAGTPYLYDVCEISGQTAMLERRIPHRNTHFDIDVGFLSGQNVVGAVEVWYAHKVDTNKAWELTKRFPWVEVRAESVLSAEYGAVLPTKNSGRIILLAVHASAWSTVTVAKAAARAARESAVRAAFSVNDALVRVSECGARRSRRRCRERRLRRSEDSEGRRDKLSGPGEILCRGRRGEWQISRTRRW